MVEIHSHLFTCSYVTGYGCGQQDWGEALPRVLSTNRRGCPRGFPVRHSGCASQSDQAPQETPLCGLVDYLLGRLLILS